MREWVFLAGRTVALTALLTVVGATSASAHESPLGCTSSGAAASFDAVASDLGVIHRNGDRLNLTARVRNDGADACDVTDATVTIQTPNPDGTPGPVTPIASGVNLIAGTPQVGIPTTVPYDVDFNDSTFSGFVTVALSGTSHYTGRGHHRIDRIGRNASRHLEAPRHAPGPRPAERRVRSRPPARTKSPTTASRTPPSASPSPSSGTARSRSPSSRTTPARTRRSRAGTQMVSSRRTSIAARRSPSPAAGRSPRRARSPTPPEWWATAAGTAGPGRRRPGRASHRARQGSPRGQDARRRLHGRRQRQLHAHSEQRRQRGDLGCRQRRGLAPGRADGELIAGEGWSCERARSPARAPTRSRAARPRSP